MLRFSTFLREAQIDADKLDMDFIRRAEVVTSFNITAKDFQSLKYKNEIRFLFKKHFFPDFELSLTTPNLNETKVNSLISMLKSQNPSNFNKLYKYNAKGIGPGEVLLYFLVDDLVLGGGASAGVDLFSGGSGFEMKSCKLSDGYFWQFRLGGTVNVSSIVKAAASLMKEAGIRTTRETEISKSAIQQIKRTSFAKRWEDEVETPFVDLTYREYFGNHDFVFAIDGTPKKLHGTIFIKKVKKTDIAIELITQGKPRPMIRK